MRRPLTCFKAYDVRGRLPDELNESIAFRIGRAFAQWLRPETVVVGHDIRLSGPALLDAVIAGLSAEGSRAIHIGPCGTEEIYFATGSLKAGAGIMVTASHNPADWNGMKFVRAGAQPVSGDSGLDLVRSLAEAMDDPADLRSGTSLPARVDNRGDYVKHLLTYVDRSVLAPLTIVVNAGNGSAGPVIDKLEPELPFRFVKVHHEPDGRFPHGVPNPLLPENRAATRAAVIAASADLGVAWDGDFDRCFFFDERGEFIEGYYVVGLLAEAMLARQPGGRVIHDPRLIWNTQEIVAAAGGTAIQSKTGHAFIKERMRAEDAVYGGEMSAHHYFRDFAYCDSGMIPWLLVAQLLCRSGRPLSSLVSERIERFPVSGEINRRVTDPAGAIGRVRERYASEARREDLTDGLGLEFADWRFNLRLSNTEPVIRLNVEARGDARLLAVRRDEILSLLDGD
ncbi:MAG: phosphomannomutase [Gammaproteobacteria bacterium]|nr:phosphomannomutase [Gammaproteobacteria bacterium]